MISSLDGQFSIAPPNPHPVDRHADVRPHDGDAPREARNGADEVAK